jgi:hypothetical protein
MNLFFWGVLTGMALVAGLFFFKFWRDSHDRLFIFFGLAFWTLAAHWAALAIVHPPIESRHQLYILRLVAFLVLLVGILDKNARAARTELPRGARKATGS